MPKFYYHHCKYVLAFVGLLLAMFSASAQAQVLTGYYDEQPEVVTTDFDPPFAQPTEIYVETQQASNALTDYDWRDDGGAPLWLTEPAVSPPAPSTPVVAELTPPPPPQGAEPVDLDADSLVHDEDNQIITASGDVFLTQTGRILRADKIVYDLRTDKVEASGHVVINEPNGDIHYADYIEVKDKMKDGFVRQLQTTLNDGSRFFADEGERIDGNKTKMYDATYTPCEPCESDPDKAPTWQIRAAEVTHDEESQTISYKHARLEAFGVPVAYTPYFSHPDGTVERKSGFLAPSFGFSSSLGNFIGSQYYWNIAPDQDTTFGLTAYTKKNPLGTLAYRKRWESASLVFEGSGTSSKRRGKGEESARGHIFAKALWDINDKWRSGLDVEWSSDDRYLRQYNFRSKNVLESQLYAERFSGRDYFVARLVDFQDTRVRDEQEDQPEILPEIVASFVGEPNSVPVIKGRWRFEGSALGLRRNSEGGQDVNRVSAKGGWDRRLVSDYGLLTDVSANARWDFYNVRDRDVSTPGSGISDNATDSRFFPSLHVESSYPMAKEFERMQVSIEPVVSLTLAQNIDVNDDIPNEDSQDVQIDTSNLFEPNRFPGFDRIEDKSHLTYGVRTGLYGYEGSRGEVFLGQSLRFEDDDNPFPEGSGLSDQQSDIVGQVSGRYTDMYSLDYRFQLDGRRLSSRRHELDASADWNRFRLNTRYLYANALEGTDISESREQVQANAAYYLTKEWRVRGGGTQDFGDNPGLRKSYVGVDYLGQCLFWSLTGQRNLTDDDAGESDTEVIFRIALKNLGNFVTSDLRREQGASYSQ